MIGSAISQKRRCRKHFGADNSRSCCSSLGFAVRMKRRAVQRSARSNTPNTHLPAPTLPLGDTPNTRVLPQTLALATTTATAATTTTFFCYCLSSPVTFFSKYSHPWPAPNCPPTPTPPKVYSSTVSSSSRKALFKPSKPLFWCGRPSGSGGRHVKSEHVKDAANATFQHGAFHGALCTC